ncbi:MAG: hypothetical protein JNN00_00760 [Chitinophagaceae bacterium]|nr:hypothetical protein [Chitinophagaceae bacterium]
MTEKEYTQMFSAKKLILKGKRWRKFHEFTVVPTGLCIATTIGCVGRISKVGFTEWPLIPFFFLPITFLCWWIPYKNRELKFTDIETSNDQKGNHALVTNALNKLNWGIKKNTPYFIESFTSQDIGFTWGSDMITILLADKKILINCISNVDIVKNQAFFTFGHLSRTIRKLRDAIEKEINVSEKGKIEV